MLIELIGFQGATQNPSLEEAPMSLTDDLAERRAAARGRIAPADLATMDAATDAMTQSGLAQRAIAVGATAPDFTLPGATGNNVQLANELKSGPVVLSFYRGGWCPYCNLELRALQAALDSFGSHGATLIAVSPQAPDASLTTAEKHGLGFPVLSDVGNDTARRYGLVFAVSPELRETYERLGIDLVAANGDESHELPIPATYVIDPSGTVRFAFVNADYTKRADPTDVIDALRSISSDDAAQPADERLTG